MNMGKLSFTKLCLIIIGDCSQERFPDPKSLVKDLHQAGFNAIWMLDPGIKYEEGYFVYDSGSERDIWVQTKDGRPFVGAFLFPFTFVGPVSGANSCPDPIQSI